jgi:allantoinase
MDVIIRNGTIVYPNGQERADIGIQDGLIGAIAPHIKTTALREIDATGWHIFAGLIDPHVHFNEPGRTEWEGLASGTQALVAGGVTTFFDMPLNSNPPVTTLATLQDKLALMREKSLVNAYAWGGLIPQNLHELATLHQHGVIGFKAFMSNSGIAEFPAVDDYTLYEGTRTIGALGSILAVHAENDGITSGLAQHAQQHGKTSIADYLASRPVIAECEAIQRAILMAHEAHCALYIVHTSSAQGVQVITQARQQGVDVTCETCPHYLVLSDDDVQRLGAVAKCAPPLRSKTEQEALWAELLAGNIHTIASDHSPSDPALKHDDNFFRVWGGISGCQSTLSLLLTFGHFQRGMTLEHITQVTAYNIAKRFGLAQKGRIALGADADLAIVDVNAMYTLRAQDLHYRHKVSPYVGMTLRGQVKHTLVNGKVVFSHT